MADFGRRSHMSTRDARMLARRMEAFHLLSTVLTLKEVAIELGMSVATIAQYEMIIASEGVGALKRMPPG
jgi:transcriptional regulator with XRE-family HTH domain